MIVHLEWSIGDGYFNQVRSFGGKRCIDLKHTTLNRNAVDNTNRQTVLGDHRELESTIVITEKRRQINGRRLAGLEANRRNACEDRSSVGRVSDLGPSGAWQIHAW